ncbi:hypothetical protein N7E70_002355 [Aminobacter sp. NyZ550]|jgi:hypothetical protein|uniref:hypothetical protein n=1 Tax=Aminobacter sp. NyZ550 TaxID=2979870 RepID=UPI0021D593C9|nr:hypothetical protein [Aminobacter sp. NyZ550]WAX95746.1 hypothetical protein N7E70_002355 [Aminobacter sp. NyZ550]
MLSVGEFTSGTLSDAHSLALVLPRRKYEEPFLIGRSGDKRVAVFIGENHAFLHFTYDTSDDWSGLIINGVSIEMDETSIFDPDFDTPPLGSIIRQETQLCICAASERGFGRLPVVLVDQLAPTRERSRVGFLRWQIVIGQDMGRRVLRTVDVSPKASA